MQTPAVFWLGGGINNFPQLLNVHGFNDVRQTEVHTAEPLVPESSAFEFEMTIYELIRHKSANIDKFQLNW